MAEFSTTKITPTDGVQVPSVSGSTSGYMEMDEVKSYVVGTLPTDVQANTEDIGENTSDIEGIRGSSQAFDATAAYSAGDYCIYENVLYRFTSAKSAGAWDSAIVTVVDLPTLDGAITSLIKTVSLDLTTDSGGFAFYEFDAPIRILSVFVKGRNGTNVNGWMAGFSTFSPDLTYKKYYFTIYDNVGSSFGAKDITLDVTYQDIAQS